MAMENTSSYSIPRISYKSVTQPARIRLENEAQTASHLGQNTLFTVRSPLVTIQIMDPDVLDGLKRG
jgi:hypothetical protein